MRDYVAVPYEYIDELDELTDEEFGRLVRSLLLYSRDGTPIEATGNERFYVKRVQNREDRYKANFDRSAERRSAAGRKGATARWQSETGDSAPADDATACEGIAKDATACEGIDAGGKNGDTDADTKANADTDTKADNTAACAAVGASAPAAEERAQKKAGGEAVGTAPARKRTRKPAGMKKAVATYEEMAGKYAPGAIPPKVDEQFRRWISHSCEKHVPITDTAMAGMLQKTADAVMQYGEDRVAALFDLCITSGWTGVFFERLKEQPGARGQPARKAAGPIGHAYDFDELENALNAAGG